MFAFIASGLAIVLLVFKDFSLLRHAACPCLPCNSPWCVFPVTATDLELNYVQMVVFFFLNTSLNPVMLSVLRTKVTKIINLAVMVQDRVWILTTTFAQFTLYVPFNKSFVKVVSGDCTASTVWNKWNTQGWVNGCDVSTSVLCYLDYTFHCIDGYLRFLPNSIAFKFFKLFICVHVIFLILPLSGFSPRTKKI